MRDFEHIIVDDGCQQATQKLVESYGDPRLLYIAHRAPQGAAGARNTGIRNARGHYINLLDDDDEYLPGILEKTAALWTTIKDRHIGFVWTGVTRVQDTSEGEKTLRTQVWPSKFSSEKEGLMVSTAIGNGFGLSMRRMCAIAIGPYDKTLPIGEDTDFLIRLSKNYHFRTVPEVLVKIHHHDHFQLTDVKNSEIRRSCYQRIIERHIAFLERHWEVLYIHSMAYINHCYRLGRKMAGRRAFLRLIRRSPRERKTYRDWFCFEWFGCDYDTYLNRRATRRP